MRIPICLLGLLLLLITACAHYDTIDCYDLAIKHAPESQGVSIASRMLTKANCMRYLNCDVTRKGYFPIQIYITNSSEQTLTFSPEWISLESASVEEVANRVHSSTLGHIAGYGATSLLASPLFAVPSVIEEYRSAEANIALDHDLLAKAARECTLAPHTHANMILFVPKENFEETFTVTLINQKTHTKIPIITSTH